MAERVETISYGHRIVITMKTTARALDPARSWIELAQLDVTKAEVLSMAWMNK
jgi:hypothetical protein